MTGDVRKARIFDVQGDIHGFVRRVRDATSPGEIGATMSEAARRFGFDHFALVQRSATGVGLGAVRLSDYPRGWIRELAAVDFQGDDPVLAAAARSTVPFAWDQLAAIVALTPAHRAFMAAAAAHGLTHGYSVPIHVPGEPSGLCSFVVSGDRGLPAAALPAAQHLAFFAFAAARRLVGDGGAGVPRLTPRQRDCVVLAAQGKSNWVAGKLLGIAPDTVHKYLESAKQRYGVSSRTELVVRSLYAGELRFSDIIGGSG